MFLVFFLFSGGKYKEYGSSNIFQIRIKLIIYQIYMESLLEKLFNFIGKSVVRNILSIYFGFLDFG